MTTAEKKAKKSYEQDLIKQGVDKETAEVMAMVFVYCFYDFDGTTGFDLWGRMNEKDKQYISNIAERFVKR